MRQVVKSDEIVGKRQDTLGWVIDGDTTWVMVDCDDPNVSKCHSTLNRSIFTTIDLGDFR